MNLFSLWFPGDLVSRDPISDFVAGEMQELARPSVIWDIFKIKLQQSGAFKEYFLQ